VGGWSKMLSREKEERREIWKWHSRAALSQKRDGAGEGRKLAGEA